MGTYRFRLMPRYTLPDICCVCGAPAGKGVMKVSKSSRPELAWDFPLCDLCNYVYRTTIRKTRIGCFTTFGTGIMMFTIAMLLSAMFNPETGYKLNIIYAALIISGISFLAGTIWMVLVNRRIEFQRFSRAVQIKKYHQKFFSKDVYLVISFDNHQFTQAFIQLNGGTVERTG